MEPQNNGLNKPGSPSGQQSPAAWWQTEQEQLANPSIGANAQPALTSSTPPDTDAAVHLQTQTTLPQTAADTDLIEDEWVAAVKKVIEQYREDPYNQSKAMTLLRADYLKKRYNKDIKVPES
jgi:hypothetical protein